MSMRITNNMVSNRVVSDLQSQYAQLANTQLQASTGRRVNDPSDDPTAASQERLSNSQLAGIQADQTSVNSSQTWLNQSESSLNNLSSVIARVKDLTTQMANGTYSQTDRNAAAGEIDQLIKSAKDAMNARVGNAYIFSGTRTDAAPYADATGDAYQGDANAVVRTGGAGVSLQNNPTFTAVDGTTQPISGGALLGSGSAAGDGKVLDTLTQIAAHMRSGDIRSLGGSDLTKLESNRVAVQTAIGAVGAMGNRATAAVSRLQDMEDNVKNSISDLTGVDWARALSDYSTQNAAYQAALKVGAQIIQPSLVQFLS